MLSSHIVSCGSAICPIMPSTASVAMKPFFGVKLGRLYLRSQFGSLQTTGQDATFLLAVSSSPRCLNTAAGAEAASGLGSAFFYAGTRALLVTNWSVHSASARELITDLFRRQRADAA